MKIKSVSIPVVAGFTLFMLLSGNAAFFTRLIGVYPWSPDNMPFLFSVGILTFGLMLMVIALMSCVLPVRWVLGFLVILTMLTGYFSDTYGTVLDTTMIRNMLETNVEETLDLATVSFLLRALVFGVLPLVLLWKLPAGRQSVVEKLRGNLGLAAMGLALVGLCLGVFSAQYASFFREHKSVRFYSNPVFPVYSLVKYGAEFSARDTDNKFELTMEDAYLPDNDEGKELIIVVVGETARRDRFSLNGYERDTNPRLGNEPGVVSYSNITACGTSTAVSVPCMFSGLKAKDFYPAAIKQHENILDVLQRVGVSVLWRDNNSDSKGVATRVPFEDFRHPDRNPVCDPECRDIGMLDGLQAYVDAAPRDVLIVLHQMGSHGPAYHQRYPAEFEHFQPVCRSAELQSCTREEIDNAYDNTILYTDYFLSEVIAFLKANNTHETAMMYISDHGESLGENGLYLHGLPTLFAPKEQLEVPVIVWVGGTSDIELVSAMEQANVENSHDAVFGSLAMAFELISDREQETTLFSLGEHAPGESLVVDSDQRYAD